MATYATPINRLVASISNAPGLVDSLVISAAKTGYRSFGSSHDGKAFTVVIVDGTAWEVRSACIYRHATTTLTRGVLEDSSTGSAIALSASAIVSVTQTAKTTASGTSIPVTTDSGTGYGRVTSLLTPSVARGLLLALRTRITAASSTVSDAELNALQDPLERLIRSSAWAKLRELWVPVGSSLAGALVKIKSDPTAGTSMTGVSLVGGDYTPSAGITGNGSSKAVDTGFNPTTAGVTANDWGFGAYVTGLTASGVIAGTSGGAGTYIGYQTANTSNINQQAAGTQRPHPRWNAVQIGGGNATTWTGSYVQATTAMGTGTLDNSSITLLSTANSFFSSNTVCGWAAWSPSLTAVEMRELTVFFDAANLALWRPAWAASLVTCGDSNTAGYGLASPTTSRWSVRLAGYLGLTEDNRGYSATSMSNNDDGSSAARWVTNYDIAEGAARSPTLMTVMLGTNDDRYAVSADNFQQDYETWLNWQLQDGVDPSQIILMAPIACTDVLSSSARQQQFRDIILQLAAKYGCGFYDTWALTNGQSSYFQPDLIHLSDAGHAAVAAGVRDYIGQSMSGSTLRRVAS